MQAIPEVRVARFEDYPAISALESTHGLISKPFEEWKNLWTGNPAYRPEWPIGWVLESGGKVVGAISNVPLKYEFRGAPISVAVGHGWVVDEAHRTYALLLFDEYMNQPNVDLYLGTTVNDQAEKVHVSYGHKRVPRGDWTTSCFMVAGYRGFAESALRIKELPLPGLLSYPAAAALAAKDKLTGNDLPPSNADVQFVSGFNGQFEQFWQRLRDGNQNLLAVRSTETLRWHFGPGLEQNKLWIMTAQREGSMQAYAVYQRRDEERYGLKRMRLVDFQALETPDQYCSAFTKRALDQCSSQGIHLLEQIGCDLEKTRVFEKAAPYRRKLKAWTYFYLANDRELSEALAHPEAWDPSSYDGDSSL